MDLAFENWGLMDYELALKQQESMVESVRHKQKPATVIFCTHSPLVTKGRATQDDDITHWSGPIYDINRGGRATYHGPNQLMIYPIVSLQEASQERRPSDVGSFLRQFELAIVDTLNDLGLRAQGKTFQTKSPKHPDSPINSPIDNENVTHTKHSLSENQSEIKHRTSTAPVSVDNALSKRKNEINAAEETGVWIENRKIASLGLSIRHWVTFHGAALNIEHDPQAFQGLKPCGFNPSVMTSIEKELGRAPNRDHIIEQLKIHLQKRL